MGVFTFTEENTSSLSPAKLFKGLVVDGDTLIPKAVDAIKSIEIIEGNGGPGTIKKISFLEGGKLCHGKHKVEAVDQDNFVYNYSLIENETFPDTLEKISIQTKLTPCGSGSLVNVTIDYVTKGDAKPTEEELKVGKEKAQGLFNAVEEYLDLGQSFL